MQCVTDVNHLDNEIVMLYNSGKSMCSIARQCHVATESVKQILTENHIEIRDNNYYKCKHFNVSYFDNIDTPEKAYWLGFIYADGNVTRRKNADKFQIKLCNDDIEHLIKLRSCLSSTHSIGRYTQACAYGEIRYCSFGIANQHLVDTLITKGVTYKKTLHLQFPSSEIVPDNLLWHFIRGYFDGDGSICWTNNKNKQCGVFSIVGVKDFLAPLLERIKKVVSTHVELYSYKNHPHIYEIRIGGRNLLTVLYKYLYTDAIVFLERKYKKFSEIIGVKEDE